MTPQEFRLLASPKAAPVTERIDRFVRDHQH